MSREIVIKSEAHTLLEIHMNELGLQWEAEFQFCPGRKFRADYRILMSTNAVRPLIEIQGGIWSRGRHVRGLGYLRDLDKQRMAAVLGYMLIPFGTQEVKTGRAKSFLQEWLCQ